ncbi:HAMP domain-containing histidine kinase [Nocardiopsis exhalans]|uniref:histidine kinase n=1 Tax=Nocardiopsis exhalans TaxID=163604 RepID=A0ABY5D3H9_9ACTN|nr:HAMP domain-containing sensor histidine kinase [Nocardiopsis exhalans]USY17651.1 HAMP domain-containing histidine kinase [Nocardiopsis exhalans]
MAERQERSRGPWRALRPRTIRARVTAGAVAMLALVLCVALTAAALLIRELTLSQLRERAAEGARHVVDHIMTERYDGPIPASEPITRFQVIDWQTDEVLAASDTLRGVPPLTEHDPEPGDFRLDDITCGMVAGDQSGDCFQVVGYAVTGSAYGDDVLVLAATRTPLILAENVLEMVLLGTSVALLFGTGIIIWYGVGRALRPVEQISAEMDRLSVSDLHRRLPVPKSDDEIAHLARTANSSLARLEEAVTRQRRFVSDASHELRNPIAGMRTKLEVELSDPEPDQRARERLLTGLLSDTERLENIVSDLLELARLDTDVAMKREKVDLSDLAEGEFSGRRGSAEVLVHTSGPVYAYVNRLRVVRVLTNLVANAERHANGRIDIIVQHHQGAAVVEVHDDGSGIPVKDRERVFERFSRLPESRERDPGGSGLGLPISREIVQAYGGTLVAGHSDLLGGALFVLRLPDPSNPPSEQDR